MATTARRWEVLVNGFRDTAGAVLASGKVRWYNPDTLVAATAYTDAACATPATAPLTLDSAGQGTLYFLEPVRVIVKDSTETTTYYDDIPALNRHDSVYLTHTSWNSGTETTLETILGTIATNLGADGKWLESAGATAIAYSTVLGQLCVPVTAFGATGDGTTDDTTAIQAAMDRVEARGGGWVLFPKGTYKITAALTIDTAGVNLCGTGRASIIKNFGTTTNAITVNVSNDCKTVIKDLAITANTTSSGAGISFTAGDHCTITNVEVALHRTGISVASSVGARLNHIKITSTDDNAAAVGVALGAAGRLTDSEIICGTTNGSGVTTTTSECRIQGGYIQGWATGVNMTAGGSLVTGAYVTGATTGILVGATDSSAIGCDVFNCTTAYSITGARAMVTRCTARTGTTGFSLGVANASVTQCSAASFTTGFTVGAFANCRITQCIGASNTTDLSVNGSATLLVEHSNDFTTLSDSATTPHSWLKDRPKVNKVTTATSSSTTPTITPTPQTCDVYVMNLTAAGAISTCTLAATSTTGLVDGQEFTLVIQHTAGSGTPAMTIDAQWTTWNVSAPAVPAVGQGILATWVWRSGGGGTWALKTPVTPASYGIAW